MDSDAERMVIRTRRTPAVWIKRDQTFPDMKNSGHPDTKDSYLPGY